MNKLIFTVVAFVASFGCVGKSHAQTDSVAPAPVPDSNLSLQEKKSVWERCREKHIFDGLDAGISLSTLGVGLEVKTPVTKWVEVRAGVDWLPRFSMPMSFNLNTFSDGLPTGNFNKVASMLYDMTGIEIDETVNMTGRGSMVNFKFMVDVFPVPSNRHWHITAGFYVGTSKIATAINTLEEKPTLVGLNIYNRAYEYFTNPDLSIFDVPLGGGAYMSPEMAEKLVDRFTHYGRMGIHIGDFAHDMPDGTKAGQPYIMEPAPDGTISAKALVNRFKPYLGAGYSTDLDKAGRWHFGVDLGVVFWGGEPDVVQYDYAMKREINFTKDLTNIRGKVGRYMKIVKAFPVYPMVALRFSYSIL